ncbi:gamma-glutamyltranspeptidase/glutathione hydrolase [Litorimonas taeanensis]|uniref:Glutathione hydrolase proenzyme n=1 Tax=Litorimonas taeanensis TaxID=568099 RepID=A0A420WEA3_9PROT|nr:gamma-glutamyltransferase [Litorimonas taeanensis]RKQ69232.1 gamma-glutamyltranspeptidase/glutathione hydrolase [Litorimonas taeanensis]
MRLLSTLFLGTILSSGLVACSNTSKAPPAQDPIELISQTPALASGMVAAANPLATQAGIEILNAGGSAIDAAIAVQTVLGLVEPQSSGLGGGAFMVVYDPETAKVWNYNGRETAPSNITDELFLDPNTGAPLRYFEGIASGRSTGVPGAMVMLHKAYEDYGKLPWGEQMEPAIQLAEEGFKVSPRMASLVKRMSGYVLANDTEARDYFFLEDGKPITEGFVRDNKPYAETLYALQENPRALVEGPIAEAIIAKTQAPPLAGTLTLEDMAAYQAQKTEAVCSQYRDHILCGAQPPASGPIAVMSILGVLENYDMKALGPSADGWHVFAEASALSYADRDKYVADPDFVEVPTKAMLNKDYLKSRAALIQTQTALTDIQAGNPVDFIRGQDATPDSPGTSHFTIVDKTGLTVSMTTTVEAPFGSQRMTHGFMLNNQLTDFSFRPVDAAGKPIANAPAPRKRPRSSMAPMIVFNPQGEFLFTTGSPGGNSIIAYTAKSIVGMIDWGLTPQDAIELPNVISRNGRVRLESQDLKSEETDEIDRGAGAVEFGLPNDIVSALEEKGHQVVRSKGEISGLHIIYRQADGTLIGGADPRREGIALPAE